MKKLMIFLILIAFASASYGQLLAPKGIKYKGALLRPAVAPITVAANNATASEKAQADYICDGTNDEVQWALANTVAVGGIVKLLGVTFTIQDDIILTASFEGRRAVGGDYGGIGGTQINLSGNKQIKLHAPGNLKDVYVATGTRSAGSAAVKMEVLQTTTVYEWQNNLLDGLRLYCSDNTGTGLQIYVQGGTNFKYVSYCYFGNIGIYNFKTNVSLKNNNPGANIGFINSNTFNNLILSAGDTMLKIDSPTNYGQVSANTFQTIQMQCAANTKEGIFITANTSVLTNLGNKFLSIDAMDWTSVPSFTIGQGTYRTYARGYIPYIIYGATQMAKNNDIRNIQAEGYVAMDVTTGSGNSLFLNGSGDYLVEGYNNTSGAIVTLDGCNRGQVVVLRRKTSGHNITVSGYSQDIIPVDLVLVNEKDFVQLFALGGGRWILMSTNVVGILNGNLTDGAPTDAEIDGITGTTPVVAGSNCKIFIKDNNGTALQYLIQSDGTYWYYSVVTKAI